MRRRATDDDNEATYADGIGIDRVTGLDLRRIDRLRRLRGSADQGIGCRERLDGPQNDFYEWSAEVAALLPSGSGVICLDSTPDDGVPGAAACDGAGDVLSIKLWWSEKGVRHRFVTTLRP
jgi:hypothetical protein